ncbi:MAG: chorismate mutase [Actinobacteria bacterium]|nr:chorismate mutase [Actinomycetota bacterium]MBM3697647.1 chorismate mutase [Actinomycetota bacterium]
MRAIRGAITVTEDTPDEVVSATRLMLEDIIARNDLLPDDMVSLIFTATGDVTSQFPAVAAREMGLLGVPLLCATEIPVPGSLPMCVRVMLHAYMPVDAEVSHSYLREAVRLRDDLVDGGDAGGSANL